MENEYDSLDDLIDKIHSCKVNFDSEELRAYLISTVTGASDPEMLAMKNGIDIYAKALLSYYTYDKPHDLTIDYDANRVYMKRLD